MIDDKNERDAITAKVSEGKISKEKVIFSKVYTGKQGRPKYKITEDGIRLLEYLASLNATREEIYAAMGVNESVLNNSLNKSIFQETYNKGKQKYLLNIREAQRRLIHKDNAAMAIFLGKNHLGQTDSSQIQITEKPPEDMDVNELYALLKKKLGKDGK